MSTSRHQGPVHLNWPFRKPLEPTHNLVTPEATLSSESLSQEEVLKSTSLASLAKELGALQHTDFVAELNGAKQSFFLGLREDCQR